MIKLLILLFFIHLLFSFSTYANNPDFKYKEIRSYTLEEKDDSTYYIESKVKISNEYLSKRSTKMDQFFIYQPYYSKISNITAKIGKKRISSSYINSYFDDFMDTFISDSKIHSIYINENIKKGSIISYTYKEVIKELNFFPILRIPNTNQVEFYKLEFEHDENVKVNFEFFFPRDTLDYVITHPDDDMTVLTFKNLKEQDAIDFYPYNSFLAAIKVEFIKNNKIINSSVVGDFIKWYGSLTDLSLPLDSASVSLIPDSLINNSETTLEKLKSVYDYVKKINYLADEREGHSITPLPASVTLRNQYGDCKDKSALVCAIANYMGIDVKLVAINTEDVPTLGGVHIQNFNHVINVFEHDSSLIFFDPTNKYGSLGIISENLVGKNAFLFDAQNPRYEQVVMPLDSNTIETVVYTKLDSLDKSSGIINLRYDNASNANYAINKLNDEDLENFLVTWINTKFSKISFSRFKVKNITDNLVTLESSVDLSRFIIESKTKKYIPEAPFSYMTNSINKRGKDNWPVFLDSRIKQSLNIIIRGRNFALADTSKSIIKDNLLFLFDAKNNEDNISLNYTFNVHKRVYQKDKEELIAFFQSYQKLKNKLHILQKN